MTHRHRMKRGVTPRPSDTDLRLLRRMITRGERASGDLMRNGVSFMEAAEKAEKSILPVGHQGQNNPFSSLMRLAAGLGKRMAAARDDRGERLALQAEIGRGVGLCRAALDAPERRERKDIDG